jgi:hypothetical protein
VAPVAPGGQLFDMFSHGLLQGSQQPPFISFNTCISSFAVKRGC